VSKAAISNASPLILLSRGGHGDLLRSIADKILVPDSVVAEIRARGADDSTARFINSTSWIKTVPALPIPELVLQ